MNCCSSRAGGAVWNTAFIERINGTFRERLAVLTRKCRHAARRLRALETGMYLVGCTYNWCFAHHELSKATQPSVSFHSCDGGWADRSLLEHCRTAQLSDRSACLGRSQTSRTASHTSGVACKLIQASCPSLAKRDLMPNPRLMGFYLVSWETKKSLLFAIFCAVRPTL
jgi:hypothetical protein